MIPVNTSRRRKAEREDVPVNSSEFSWRIVAVGCGSIGRRHIENLLELRVGEVLAVEARDDRRRAVAAQFGIETFETLEEAWERDPDIAVVALPTSLHIPVALQAVQRGCHLFIEKPLSDRLDGVDQLLAAVQDRGLVTLIGCNMRFHPGLVQVKKLLDQGAIGHVVAARVEFGYYLPDWHSQEDYRHEYSARRSLGGGVLLDAIHEVDYIRWMLGEIEEVFCFAGKLSSLETDTEDVAAMLLRFSDGAIGEIHLDYLQRAYSRGCHIIGEEGTIHWDYTTGQVSWYSVPRHGWQDVQLDPKWTPNAMYLAELRHFFACVEGTEKAALDVFDASRVLKIVLAAKTSAETGKVIRLGG